MIIPFLIKILKIQCCLLGHSLTRASLVDWKFFSELWTIFFKLHFCPSALDFQWFEQFSLYVPPFSPEWDLKMFYSSGSFITSEDCRVFIPPHSASIQAVLIGRHGDGPSEYSVTTPRCNAWPFPSSCCQVCGTVEQRWGWIYFAHQLLLTLFVLTSGPKLNTDGLLSEIMRRICRPRGGSGTEASVLPADLLITVSPLPQDPTRSPWPPSATLSRGGTCTPPRHLRTGSLPRRGRTRRTKKRRRRAGRRKRSRGPCAPGFWVTRWSGTTAWWSGWAARQRLRRRTHRVKTIKVRGGEVLHFRLFFFFFRITIFTIYFINEVELKNK